MLRPKAIRENGQRAPHQGLGLREAVRGLKQLRKIVQVSGHVGMTGAEAFLVDGQRAPHQGLGLGKSVRVLKQLRQIVEADGHLGMTGAEAFLAMASARRIKGSASARRFVA